MAATLTNASFNKEVIMSDKPVLIDFYADWCMPCKMLAPIIDEISREVDGAKVFKVNIDQEKELARQFDIMSIPTLVVMKDGKVSNTAMGVRSKSDILKMLSV